MGKMRNVYNISIVSSKGRDHSEDLGVDGRTTVGCILGKEGGEVWSGCVWLRIG
jgi:hypothetical protein